MEKEKFLERLMVTFLDELEEGVRTLNQELVSLEKSTSDQERAGTLKTLFRTAHSLKGASRSVGLPLLEESCHALEESLALAGDGKKQLDAVLFEELFAATDFLHKAAAVLRGGNPQDGAPADPAVRAAEATSRVSSEKLDRLMADSGELLIARRRGEPRLQQVGDLRDSLARWQAEWRLEARASRKPQPEVSEDLGRAATLAAFARTRDRFKEIESGLESLWQDMTRDGRAVDQAAGALDEGIRRARMLPFSEACDGLERTVRDMAQNLGKEVRLVIHGGELELDRSVVERLRSPILHLVRNAVDHGLEASSVRGAAGKAACGKVEVIAALKGGSIEISVRDDGRGLDLAAIRSTAGLTDTAGNEEDERALARLIFNPGFSTTREVTRYSGRGIGLDVVKKEVETIHGSFDFSFEKGKGTHFWILVPLTLTTLRALLVRAGDQVFAFLSSSVEGLVRLDSKALHLIEGREKVMLDGQAVAVHRLETLVGAKAAVSPTAKNRVAAVVFAAEGRRAVAMVDQLLGVHDIVVKGLGPCFPRLRLFAGATVLSSGTVALILNTRELVETALGSQAPAAAERAFPKAAGRKVSRILMADDSVTTRSLEKSILEAAGYQVMAAADGAEAWEMLQAHGADLLVSDVEMPLMDGFSLTEAVRASLRFKDLPIILVTALSSEAHRAKGVKAGADAYLVKSAFDQRELLTVISQLL